MIKHLFKRFLKFSTRSWTREATLRSSTLVILVFTYAITIFLVTSAINFKSIVGRWGESAKISVYVENGQSTEQIEGIHRSIAEMDHVADVKFLSSDVAMREFAQDNKIFPETFIKDLKENSVFTDSFEITLRESLHDEKALSYLGSVSEKIEKIIGIDEVSYGQGWVERYAEFLKFSNFIIIMIVLLFSCATLIMISNMIRVLIYNYREEIEILELVGETQLNIRLPFVLEGIIFSLVSFVVGLILNTMIFHWIDSELSQSILLSQLREVMVSPSFVVIITGIFMSSVFGALSAFYTTRSINTGWAFSRRKK